MSDSILTSVKKVLGLDAAYTPFDQDVVMHINAVFGTLNQLGIGPESGYQITDATASWTDFLGSDPRFNQVKTYVYLRVRLLFDPPTSGFGLKAVQDQITEFEWRLNVLGEGETSE